MANPDQKTILIDNAFEEIKNICINLQKDTNASNLEVKNLLKLIMNEWEERKNKKLVLDSGKVCHYLKRDPGIKLFKYEQIFYFKILYL